MGILSSTKAYPRRFFDTKYTIKVRKWYVSTEPVWPMWWTRRDPWLPRRAWGGSRQNHSCASSSEILLQLLNKLFILLSKRSSFDSGKFGQYPKHTNQTRRVYERKTNKFLFPQFINNNKRYQELANAYSHTCYGGKEYGISFISIKIKTKLIDHSRFPLPPALYFGFGVSKCK